MGPIPLAAAWWGIVRLKSSFKILIGAWEPLPYVVWSDSTIRDADRRLALAACRRPAIFLDEVSQLLLALPRFLR